MLVSNSAGVNERVTMTEDEIQINAEKDAKGFEILTSFGLDENTAFEMQMEKPLFDENASLEFFAETSDQHWQ